ncbi:MAG: GNAT family N-acetyltransferase [Deltaproteobacteria bacterium]|nr:GNAT family N-acetyltransferase [Deltaproteobacteria bacterium]
MSINLHETAIFHSPHAFIDKRGEPILIEVLDEIRHDDLVEMYMEYQPRASFNGLPPVNDAACASWVRSIICEAANLVAVSFTYGVVGHTGIFRMSDGRCEVIVVIATGHQRYGIGTEITRCSVQLACELGFRGIWLCVEADNHVARHVYRKCGFQYLLQSEEDDVEMCFDLECYHQQLAGDLTRIVNRDARFIRQNATCRDATHMCLANHLRCLPVLDGGKRVIGILTATDLIAVTNPDQKINDIVTRGVVTLKENSNVATALRLLHSGRLRCIPVTDAKARFVGTVGRREILAHYLKTVWADGSGTDWDNANASD